ncbi:hypothetical protein IWX83_003452 [Flavobacterium sp. CG_9.1]|uniref:hypothetical protein n=1 Tax=Flavobacterium sp. CG_9.1 TaxID=2787728 RepID=UPI0018CAD5DF|nr:hypothetical protein [Flavobacterium sp. CG_9.1]MBG6063641.1 hypothetical protein [Flavobacterium sp. CG_9.1]
MTLQKNTEEKAYSYFELELTSEIHIFEGKFTPSKCNAEDLSICGKTSRKGDNMKQIIICLNEDGARKKASSIGRNVCGTCVSYLYESYE